MRNKTIWATRDNRGQIARSAAYLEQLALEHMDSARNLRPVCRVHLCVLLHLREFLQNPVLRHGKCVTQVLQHLHHVQGTFGDGLY